MHGDVIRFVADTKGLSYKEAAISIANDYNITIPQLTIDQKRKYEELDDLINILEIASSFFMSHLSEKVSKYLYNRGITNEAIKKFSIGFAPSTTLIQEFFIKQSISLTKLCKTGLFGKKENGKTYVLFHNRIIFPIKNVYNKTIGFGGRVLDNELPKYLNSPDTMIFHKNEILYGENNAINIAYKKNNIILVEGYLDVITLHQNDFKQTVATLGTSVTQNHISKLWNIGDEIILCLDNDIAGIKATQRVIDLILPLINTNKKASFIRLPPESDPNDTINRYGINSFIKMFNQRINLSEMIWCFEYENKNFITPEDKAILENNLNNYCAKIKDTIIRNNYSRYFKSQIWIHLIKNKNTIKLNMNTNTILLTTTDYSEIEILEQSLCIVFIKFPILTKNKDIINFFLTVNFQNPILIDFRSWFLIEIINNNILDHVIIIEKLKKTRFYNTFLVLLTNKSLFLDLSLNSLLSKSNTNVNLLWQCLYKKHQLILLKQKYTSIIQSNSDTEFKKAILYHQDIVKISKEIHDINESFIN